MRRRVHRPHDDAATGSLDLSALRPITPVEGTTPPQWRRLSRADVAVPAPAADPLDLDEVSPVTDAVEADLDRYRNRLRLRLDLMGEPPSHDVELPRIDGAHELLDDMEDLRARTESADLAAGTDVDVDALADTTDTDDGAPEVIDLRDGAPPLPSRRRPYPRAQTVFSGD